MKESKEAVQSTLSKDAYWMVNKKIAAKVGNDGAILLADLISKAQYFESKNQMLDQVWFFNTKDNIATDTGISEDRQFKFVELLKAEGFIETKLMGLPARLYYAIDYDKIDAFLHTKPCSRKSRELHPVNHGDINNNKGNNNKEDSKDSPPEQQKPTTFERTSPPKPSSSKTQVSPEVLGLSRNLAHCILIINPKNRELSKDRFGSIQRWAKDIDKLHRLDGQSLEDIEAVILFCTSNASWWRGKILSGANLREHWDRLYMEMVESTKPKGKIASNAVQAPKGKYDDVKVHKFIDGVLCDDKGVPV